MMYDYSMFTFLHGILQTRIREAYAFTPGVVKYVGTGTETDEYLRMTYAFLESYLLHARVLHDFFYKTQSRDDIVAEHFVGGWDGLKPALHSYLATDDRRNRLDKSLAHLTLKRLEYDRGEKRWDVDAIKEAIETPMQVFRESLIGERKPWFEDWKPEADY